MIAAGANPKEVSTYFPDSGLIIALNLNSQPNDNKINTLNAAVYDTLVANRVVPAP
jgi:D-alanyl-D-alanine carboxypeptidase